MAKKIKKKPEEKGIKILWNDADASLVFANQLMVSLDENECYLSFFTIQPPNLFGSSPEEKMEQLSQIESIEARCTVKVVTSVGRLRDFAKTMLASLQSYEQRPIETDDIQENDDDDENK